METKKPWFSKTIIINALVGACLALSPFVPALGSFANTIKDNLVVIGTFWSILAIALRAISKGAISLED